MIDRRDDRNEHTTERQVLERLALAAFPAMSHIPPGVLRDCQSGANAVRERLDRRHGIETVLSEIDSHLRESVFVKRMAATIGVRMTCRRSYAMAAILVRHRFERGTQ